MKIVVTGAARSGTGYMAEVLRACGVRCGHEDVYNVGSQIDWADYDAESSWMAVPHLDEIRASEDSPVIIHLIRDPLACAQSFLHFFETTGTPFHDVIDRFSPWILDASSFLERFCRYWITWNRHAEAYADTEIRIEESCDPRQFALEMDPWIGSVDIDAIAKIPRNVNTRPPELRRNVRWDQILACPSGTALAQLASKYGHIA